MRDLSLHLLDLMENSSRAGATIIAVTVEQRTSHDRMLLRIEDNGPGLPVAGEMASDPFYTTKRSKRVGLGLSLFKAAAERAGGEMTLGVSPLGGLAVEATMVLGHIDRSPLGDLAATFATVVCMSSEADVRLRLTVEERTHAFSSAEISRQMADRAEPVFVAQQMASAISAAITELGVAQ